MLRQARRLLGPASGLLGPTGERALAAALPLAAQTSCSARSDAPWPAAASSSGTQPWGAEPAGQWRGFRASQLGQLRSFSRARRRQADGRRRGALSVRGRAVDAAAAEPEASSLEHQQEAIEPVETRASEHEIASIVRHPALIVMRNIEWGTVILGFEQANKYTVLDQDGNTVALLAEEGGSLGREVGRQLLRTRRSFTATILSPDGQVLLRLRRPAYLISSTIFVEDGAGAVIGEVQQRWHLWQRNYSLYLGRRQFAAVNSPLLAWEFALRDENGGVLALIDRNFQGFGKELFTDAGKYVIHFGAEPAEAARQAANTVAAAHPDRPRPQVTALARARTDVAVVPTSTSSQLEVARPLSLDERLLALAAAVSIDFDYFSQHSHGSGLLPFGLLPFPGSPPVPYPEGGQLPPPQPAEGGDAAAPGVGDAGAEQARPMGDAGSETPPGFEEPQFDVPDEFPEDDGWQDDSAGWSPDGGDGGESAASAWDVVRGIFGGDD